MVKSVPRQISGLSGDLETRDSEAKEQGRRLPKVPSSLRSLRRPCSGRTLPVPHFYVRRTLISTGLKFWCLSSSSYRTTDCAKNDGAGIFGGGEGFVGQWGAVSIDGALEDLACIIEWSRRTLMAYLHRPVNVLEGRIECWADASLRLSGS